MKIQALLLSFICATGLTLADMPSNTSKALLTAQLQGSEGNKEAEIDGLIKKIGTIGFSTVAANKNLQVHYYNKYEEKNVEMLSFFSMSNKEKIRPLLLANPDFGAYAPFNFLVYKTLDTVHDNNTWYGHLAADTMLDIIGAKDTENRKAFKSMVSDLDTLVNTEMSPSLSKKFEHTKPLPTQGLTKFVKTFEKPEDMETFIEDFITEHDSLFAKHEFIIAGFIDYKYELEDMDLKFDAYDAYWVSLLCHFKFSNDIFNRGMPEGGMFAPCSVYFYIPKGSNELHVGYASVDNWINALNFRDKERIKYMKSIDAEVQVIFEALGFRKMDGTEAKIVSSKPANNAVVAVKREDNKVNPKLTEQTAIVAKTIQKEVRDTAVVKKEITSEIKAPLPKKTFTTQKVKIGAEAGENLSAYYAAQPQYIETLKANLEKNGFKVLAESEIMKGHTVLSVTNEELQATNTYMAVLNLHINGTDEIRVQNPSYLGRAYLQDDYKKGQFTTTLKALEASLGTMYNVKDIYETSELSDYQFMMGMPDVGDVLEVAEGSDLIAHITSPKASKYVAYTLKLPNGSLLVGHKLRSRTNKFLKKIKAERNSNLLPYQSLIKEDKAIMLDPKYYLALSLPLLSMSDFMKIASVPDAIEKEIKRAYKK